MLSAVPLLRTKRGPSCRTRPPTYKPLASLRRTYVMPFHIPSVRIAQASPSISLEKGSYRMRAPPARLSVSPLPSAASALSPSDRKSRARREVLPGKVVVLVPASYEKRMALLVALLACAMLASFGTAYWLWARGHSQRCVSYLQVVCCELTRRQASMSELRRAFHCVAMLSNRCCVLICAAPRIYRPRLPRADSLPSICCFLSYSVHPLSVFCNAPLSSRDQGRMHMP